MTAPDARRAVVLAAGRGSRMRRPDPRIPLDPEQRRAAEGGLKALVPVAGRPFLDRLLDLLAAAGIERVCVVAGADTRPLRRHCAARAGTPPRLELAVQPEPRGTADALLAARRFAGDAPFLALNSDNLYPAGDLRRLRRLDGPGLVAYDARVLARDPQSNLSVERLAAFAAVEPDGEGRLRRIFERPPPELLATAFAERLVSLNCWRFSPIIFEACAAIEPSPRGELELPAAVEHAVTHLGEGFRVLRSAGPVLDLSHRADLAAAAERLAARGWPDPAPDPTDSRLGRWSEAARGSGRGRWRRLARTLIDLGLDPGRAALAEHVPGRIEVVGKHTDYAGGRTLTCATEQGLGIVSVTREDAGVRIVDVGRGERVEFEVGPGLEPREGHWSRYPMTVAGRLARDLPVRLRGFDAAFDSDLPAAAGLSSSSVLVVAFFRAFAAANALAHDRRLRQETPGPEELAAYLGAVERGSSFGSLGAGRGVGTRGGDEDHTAILCARPGGVSTYRFLPTRLEDVAPLPPGHRFAVAFCGARAEKAGAARARYNRAARQAAALAELWRQSTGEAESHLGAIAARGPRAAERLRGLARNAAHPEFSGAELLARCDHFLEESERLAPAAAAALAAADLDALGSLADRSQELASTLLGNQLPETEYLARAARELGAAAASAFGAGFGGSVWSLVADAEAGRFLEAWATAYRTRFPGRAAAATFFLTTAARGARRLGLDPLGGPA